MKRAFTIRNQILYEDTDKFLAPILKGGEIGACHREKAVRINGGIQYPVLYTWGMYNT